MYNMYCIDYTTYLCVFHLNASLFSSLKLIVIIQSLLPYFVSHKPIPVAEQS
jgi:hypothetical protein